MIPSSATAPKRRFHLAGSICNERQISLESLLTIEAVSWGMNRTYHLQSATFFQQTALRNSGHADHHFASGERRNVAGRGILRALLTRGQGPHLEHQQRPDQLAMIGHATFVFAQQPPDVIGVEEFEKHTGCQAELARTQGKKNHASLI